MRKTMLFAAMLSLMVLMTATGSKTSSLRTSEHRSR